jgi:hypothetical protein
MFLFLWRHRASGGAEHGNLKKQTMQQTSEIAGTKRVLIAAAAAALWLAGAGGVWAADAPAETNRASSAKADETVVLDNTTLWRQFQVAGASHLRDASSNLVRCTVVYEAEDGSRSPERVLAGVMTAKMFQNVSYSLNPVQAFWSPLPPTNWADPAFDDALWPRTGWPQPTLWNRKDMANAGAIGFGRCNYPYDPVLVVTRATFEVKDPGKVRACAFSLDFWGGAVVYVNGQELTRAYLATGAANLDQVADDYAPEAFWARNGKLLKHDDEKSADRLALRVRRLREVAIPPKLLRKGINVVAVEVHAAPIQGLDALAKLINGGGEPVAWPPMGVLQARLTVAPAGVATPNTQRPHGVQIWNCEATQGVGAYDYGNPAEPLRPIKIHAGRNTVFSGRLVVGSDQPIKGLKASVGDLRQQSGSDRIPASAIRVRYAEAASPEKSWLSPGQFDGLLDTIPAEISVITVPPPLKWMFYGWPVDNAGFTAGAVAPLWFTVRVPKNAKPGLYEGVVTVAAEGLRTTTVPMQVSVSAWTARDPKDFRLQLFPFSIEESLALYYNVPLWSDKHFELIRKSLALGAAINARQVFANLVVDADGPGSNPESLVRWIKQSDGSLKHDFTILDKYLNTVAQAIGKPHPLQFGWEGSATVTVFNPKSNKVENVGLAPLSGDAAVKFWKPVFEQIRKKLDARGWTSEAIFKSSNIVGGPLPPDTIDVASKLWPGGEWSSFSHNGPAEFTGNNANTIMKVRVRAHVWDGEGPGSIRKAWLPSAYPVCKIYRYLGNGENAPLSDYRWRAEELMRYGYDGLASFGLDAFPLKTPVGGYAHRSRSPGTRGFMPNTTIVTLLYPGPDGPVATERYEMLREGLQLTEALLDIEQAVAQYKAGTSDAGFWRRATRYCQDRNRAFAYGWFGDRFQQSENDAALLDLAGELTPVATNIPAAELAQLVEQVMANPTSSENRNLAKRLHAAVASLTPPQLARLYGCLKAQPKVRPEWREIAALLGEVCRTRCSGGESQLGQLLGDPSAFQMLRAFAQAMADSNDTALRAWAWLDGAAFRPSVRGLRGAYHRGMQGWNEERDQGKEFQEFVFERLDDQMAFDSREMPYPDVRQGYWFGNTAIRWTGSIEIKSAGKYTFIATADACVRVWVDDKLVINVGKAQVFPRDLSGDVVLPAGLSSFKVEYFSPQARKGAFTLRWSGPGFERQVIGKDVLRAALAEQKPQP